MSHPSHKNVVSSVLHLSRVLRRRPQGKKFPGQFRILVQIHQNPGITAAVLAANLDIRPASASEAVKRLEEAGLLAKKVIPADKRKQGLYVTKAGHKMILEHKEARQEDLAAIQEILSEEEEKRLVELCDKLVDGLQKRREPTWHESEQND